VGGGYFARMKPIINMDEKIGKTVGRRVPPKDPFEYAMDLQGTLGELQKTFRSVGVPRGVYRFHTHEEADEWMLKMLARRRK
jgi:hypothetical protein